MIIKNIFSNYVGTGLVGVINLVSLAWFAKIYGLENWGAIATCIALVNFIGLAELGLSQIYISEFSKEYKKEVIFRRFQYAIAFIGLLGAVVTTILLWVIARYFLPDKLVYKDATLVMLTLIWSVLSIVNNFYYTKLVASGHQIQQNIQWVAFTFARNAIGLLAGLYIGTKPEVYLIAIIFGVTIEILFNEHRLKNEKLKGVSFGDVKDVMVKARFLSMAIAVGIAAFYCDRVILPMLITSYDFGMYAIVATLGLYLLQLQYPIVKGLFPMIATNYHAGKISVNKNDLWLQMIGVAVVMVPPLILVGYFSREILTWYSIPEKLIDKTQVLLIGILISVLFNAVYNLMYMRMIVKGLVAFILLINALGLLVSVIVFLTLGSKDPFTAGAISWTLISLIQLLGGFASRYYLSTGENFQRGVEFEKIK